MSEDHDRFHRPLVWEEVSRGTPEFPVHTQRARVHGGWLYRCVWDTTQAKWGYSVTPCFVPDRVDWGEGIGSS